MKQVTDNLDAVAAERITFHLLEIPMEPLDVAATSETRSVLNESHHIYGREEDKEKIVDVLVNNVKDNQEISVLPVIGVGGVGKTTLAQLVFDDPRVHEHFHERIWVCVSDNFDVKTLIDTMIEFATQNTSSDSVNMDALHRVLELLKHKRYLLVLDDVWSEHQHKWSLLRNVLACGSAGSSIVVTTRFEEVAVVMGTLPPHYLKGLSEENCWMLLRERALGHEKVDYPNLEVIGKKIVKKCAGVPLAAKAIGGLLRFERSENDWIHVKESEMWDVPQEETSIPPAVRLSYRHLPLELRQCFTYCAVFPKDFEIEKYKLIFCWMVFGYISSNGALEVEEVGNEICNELVLRCLLQVVPRRAVTTLSMHGIFHDLAQSIMANKVVETQVVQDVGLPEIEMHSILMRPCRLRLSDANRRETDFSSTVCNLEHLKHLKLSSSEISSLPISLGSPSNLKALNLGKCKNLVALPGYVT